MIPAILLAAVVASPSPTCAANEREIGRNASSVLCQPASAPPPACVVYMHASLSFIQQDLAHLDRAIDAANAGNKAARDHEIGLAKVDLDAARMQAKAFDKCAAR